LQQVHDNSIKNQYETQKSTLEEAESSRLSDKNTQQKFQIGEWMDVKGFH
jgi:hypothetical protein